MKRFILSIIGLLSLVIALTSCDNMSRKQYVVTFESNGGTLIEPQIVEHDETVTKPQDPTKEGHTFVGWYSDELMTTVYDFNAKVRKPITLYANWSINSYTVSFVTNVEGYEMENISVTYGSTIYEPTPDPELFIIEGHHFAGWYLDENFETPFEEIKMGVNDLTLYAKWDKNDLKLTFVNDDLTYQVLDVQFGDILPTIEAPSKVGHTFLGWALDKNDAETVDNDFVLTQDVTLYAKWDKNKYVVTYDSNGGSTVEEKEYLYYETLIAPTAPTKEGHTFAGWYLNDEYFNFNDNRMPANDIKLVAKWTVNTYIVHFTSNGGSAVANAEVLFGTKVTEPTVPTKVGYTFEGWYLGEEKYSFDSLMPANDITLDAKWSANEYAVKFDLNGASGEIDSINAKYDESFKVPECNIERLGYTFVKWNTKADGTGTNYLELAELKNISVGDEVTLYAIWSQNEYTLTITLPSEVKTYVLHYEDLIENKFPEIEKGEDGFNGWFIFENNEWKEFDIRNAKMPNSNLSVLADYLGRVTITFVSNNQAINSFLGYESENIEFEVPTPKRDGHSFEGWYLDQAYTQEYNLVTYPSVNTTVYAKWSVNTIVIKYDGNGNTSGEMNEQNIVYGSHTPLTSNTFIKKGHEFLGWSTDKNDTEIKFVDGYNKDVATEGEVTLYAIWNKLTYSISFDSNGGSLVEKIEDLFDNVVTKPEDPTKKGYKFAGWYLNDSEYTFSRITDENITLVAKWDPIQYKLTINTKIDGVSQTAKNIDIYYDELVLEIKQIANPALEGHKFSGFYYDESLTDKAEFNNASKVENDITLYATYEKETYTVNFISNGEVIYSTSRKYLEYVSFNEYVEETKKYAAAYYELYNAILAITVDKTILANCVTKNYQYYSNNEALMHYISLGTSLTEAQVQEFYGVAKGLYDGAQTIVNIYEATKVGDNYVPNHTGHFFGGWYLGANTTLNGDINCPFTGVTPSSTIGLDTVNIIAKWEKLNFVDDLSEKENTINTITWTQITTDQLKLEANEKLEVKYFIYNLNEDGTLTLLDTVKHDSTKTVIEYTFMTANTFSAPGKYDLVVIACAQIYNSNNELIRSYEADVNDSIVLENYEVVIDPDNVSVTQSGDYYSVAGDTFYFFTNMEYTFTAAGDFALVNQEDSKYATAKGQTITTTNIPSETYFEFTNTYQGTVTTYKAYVLPYVSQFTLGKGLSNFLNSNSETSSFYGKNATYTIGRYSEDVTLKALYDQGVFKYKNNGYKFDLNILTNGGVTIDTSKFGNYLVYEFFDANDNKVEEIGEFDTHTGAWAFTAPNGDYKVKISINSLYVAPKQVKDEIIMPVTFNFTIDNSVNVYNNTQFRAVYNNTTIGNDYYVGGYVNRGISVHENIKAELNSNQYYDYWKDNPINPAVADGVDNKYNQTEALKTHTPINIDNGETLDLYDKPNYANGNVYERISRTPLKETYVINGNCFTIDGSNLPFISSYSRGNQSPIPGYDIPYNSTAIIKYIVEGTGTDKSTLVVNDLHIVGNSIRTTLDESSENIHTSIQLLNKNSGGYQGICVSFNCGLEGNNLFINKTIIGIMFTKNSSVTLNDSKITDCWFNALYGYGNGDLTINNSYMKDFGGAIIHLEDLDSAIKYGPDNKTVLEERPVSSKVTIDSASVMENYVSGDEGFFKAYSLEVLILQMKSEFEAGVGEKHWTMLKKVTDPVTGLEFEKVNLIMLLVSRGDNADKEIIDETNNIRGAGRNMMQLGFSGAYTEGLKGINSAMGTNLTHLNSSTMMNYLGGQDLLVTKANPAYSQAGYLEEGILLTYREGLPGFGGSIIVTGVNGKPNN